MYTRIACLALAMLLGAAPGALAAWEPADPDEPSEPSASPTRLVDGWPKLLLSAGLTYSPAPHLSYYRDGRNLDEKLADQVGGRVGFEARLVGYLLLGGELELSGSAASLAVEGGLRVGVLFPLSEHWALYGHGLATISVWKTGNDATRLDLEETLYGLQAGLAAGARFRFPCGFQIWLELEGLVSQFAEEPFTLEEPGQAESLYRLQLALGAAYGW